MAHVHYKFSSKLSSDTVVFDDTRITLMDLKRQIMRREKLRAADCDLRITNAQTKEEYTDDEGLIPKGSSVIIRRIPIIGVKSSSNSKTRKIERSANQHHHAFGAIKAMANLAEADVPEEEKINTVIAQASMSCPKNYIAALPANYTCYRCGDTGHHIRNCPTTGVRTEHDRSLEAPLRLKKSTGIPRSFMVEVDDPNVKGAMLTNCGHYAIPAMHAKAYAIGKKEKPPFIPQEKPKSEDKEDPVPEELLCLICHDLLSDAVVIPCCGTNYCDDCIRTTLLDSEEHVCPTCKKSHVSPDTLTANKFLRQAVNTFEKEQGQAKSLQGRCGPSQSPDPTLTPFTMQSRPQKTYQSTHNLQAANTPPSSQVCGAPPTATGPAPASNNPSTSLQTVPACPEISNKEAEEKTYDDSAPAALSALVSNKDPTAAVSQLIPLVNSPAVDQTDSVNPKQSSTGQVPGHASTCWESSFSSSGWSKSNNQPFPPFPSAPPYPTVPPPPLFLSPHFHTVLAAQQPLNRFAPGYQPPTPVWTLQTPQGAPIPSLCSSTSVSSIPTLLTKEWYMNQRKKSERSPHRRHTHRRSSSRSNSKSSKSRSSHSYSRSSSRSRSRSKGRSRPHSPYLHHKDLHTRSHSSHSYSYGYKRSPTPSSSSSPRMGYHSRSKSSSDHRKNSHHSRHHSKKSTSSRHSSSRLGESSKRETGSSRTSSASYLYAQHANKTGSPEMDRQRYLQWKQEYKEWCEKYYNSYVDHFHQLPPSSPLPPWLEREGSRNHSHTNSESLNRLQGRPTACIDDRSPPSQSSSDSRSSPLHPSSERLSTPSQSSRDRHSSPSHLSNDSRSPPSQSSSDSCSAPSGDKDQLRSYQQRCAQKHSRLPVMLTKNSREAKLQESRKDDEPLITKKSEKLRTLRYDQKSLKKHEEEIEERSSSPDAADSTDDYRKDKRKHSTSTNICKDGNPVQDIASASEVLMQPIMKPDKHLDEEERNLEIEKGWRTGKYSGSRLDRERRHKDKPSKGAGRGDRYRNSRGRKGSDSESENRKRKGEDAERSSVEAQNCKFPKTDISEVPKTRNSESLNPFEREKPKTEKKKERKTWPLTAGDIWEGEIKVKPQKKINININMDGKRTEKPDLSIESITEKTMEEMKKSSNGEEEKLNREGFEVNDTKESSKNQEDESKETIKPDERERLVWKKATFRDNVGQTRKKTAEEKKEDREEGDFDSWDCVLRTVEKQKKGSEQWEECDGMRASKEEDVKTDERSSIKGGQEEGGRVRNDSGSQEMGELVAGSQKEKVEGENACKENRRVAPGESKAKVGPMEVVKWRMMEEEDVRSKSQRSRNESLHDGPNTTVEEESSHEDHQERKMVVKTVEEFSQDRVAGTEDELVLMQVPSSKWEKVGSEEEEQDEGEFKVQTDAPAACLPSSSVSVTAETPADRETENKQQGNREMESNRSRAMDRGRDSSHRSVAPSSGKDRPGRMSSTKRDGEREKRMEMDRRTDKDKGRESERPREGQRESKSTKERAREEEKGRSRKREERHSSKRKSPSSSHPYFYLMSRDTERRDRQRGDDQGSNKSSCSPGGKSSCCRGCESSTIRECPDQSAHQTYRDMFLDQKIKDHSHCCHSPQDSSGNFRHQHRPTGTHHSSPSLSQSRVKESDLPSGFSGGSKLSKPIMSSLGRELMQDRSETVSKVEKEWNRKRVDKLMREGKCERDEGDKLDGQAEWQGGRELEEGERSSSSTVSSSASQEGSSDDGRQEWKKKQKKHKKEKRQAAPELPEGEELKKLQHKKSKINRDRGEAKSSGELDDWWREEKDHT